MLVIVLNGPINSGKTTTGRALASLLANSRFIDGDDHGAPDATPFDQMLEIAFARLEQEIAAATSQALVIAYPLREMDYRRLGIAVFARSAKMIVVSLNPPPDIALANRGERILRADEIQRSRQMYQEGYGTRAFSDLIVTDMTTPLETASRILGHFGLHAWQGS